MQYDTCNPRARQDRRGGNQGTRGNTDWWGPTTHTHCHVRTSSASQPCLLPRHQCWCTQVLPEAILYISSKSGRKDTCVNNKLSWQYCRVNDTRPNERINTRSWCYSSCPAPVKLSKQEIRSAISLSLRALQIASSEPTPNSRCG